MTVRFYLVRHGRAEDRNPGGDAARRLLPDGRAAFAAHAGALASELAVSRIATSPYARAVETARLLADATGARVDEVSELRSGASDGREVLRLGLALGPGTALVGHNPELAQAVALAAGKDVEVKPGAVAAIDADGGTFRLAWVKAP